MLKLLCIYFSEFLAKVANSSSKSNLNQETNQQTDHSQMNGNSQSNNSSSNGESSSAGKEYTSEQVEAVKRYENYIDFFKRRKN